MSALKKWAWIGVFFVAAQAAGGEISGTVAEVLSGDTLRVMTPEGAIEVRLFGAVCPRKEQPFAEEARAFARRAALAKRVTVRARSLDSEGRTLGRVILPGGIDLNHELVRHGMAWAWLHEDDSAHPNWDDAAKAEHKALKKLEAEARDAERGMWAGEAPTPPWNATAHTTEAGKDTSSPEGWRIVLHARQGQTDSVALMRDRRSKEGIVSRSLDYRAQPAFAGPVVGLPSPGRYAAVFRLAMDDERQYSNFVSRAVFMVLPKAEDDFDATRARSLARKTLDHSLLSTDYESHKVAFEADEQNLAIRPVAWKVGMVVRFDHVEIRRLPEDRQATPKGGLREAKK